MTAGGGGRCSSFRSVGVTGSGSGSEQGSSNRVLFDPATPVPGSSSFRSAPERTGIGAFLDLAVALLMRLLRRLLAQMLLRGCEASTDAIGAASVAPWAGTTTLASNVPAVKVGLIRRVNSFSENLQGLCS